MAVNTLKQPGKSNSKEGAGLFSYLEKMLNLEALVASGIPERNLFKILFGVGLVLVYIGNTHTAERNIHSFERLKQEVEDLRADYTTIKADLMVRSKQSEVARRVAPMGLTESETPPTKLEIDKDYEY